MHFQQMLRRGRAPAESRGPFGGITTTVIATMLASVSVYLRSWAAYDRLSDSVGNTAYSIFSTEKDHFDFIIVGGGTAGAVAAYRLSEYYDVLLLEAGGEMNDFQLIPAMSLLMLNYPEVDWRHKTVPQRHSCFGSPKNRSHWSQGRGLGGTSNLNFLIHARGCPKDYDLWAQLTGDPSWGFEAVLPYFKKSENYIGRWADNGFHGVGGPMTLQEPDFIGVGEKWVQATVEMGWPRADINGNFTEGFDTTTYTMKDGRRSAAYGAWLDPLRNRLTLTIRKYAHVRKVLIDGQKRAYGVEYERHGTIKHAFAKKEIVLTAGTMNTAQILMLSGVGPRRHLRNIGVPLVKDLPVGLNLQDHLSVYLGPFFVNEPIKFSIGDDVINPSTIGRFIIQGKGALTSAGTQATGFFASKYAKAAGEGDWPDVQIIVCGVSAGENFPSEIARGFGMKKTLWQDYYEHAIGYHSFFLIVSGARPRARGYIRLKNTDPMSPTRIQPNYFDNEHDVKIMVEGIKTAVAIVEETLTFNEMGGRFTDKVLPGCEQYIFRSDEYWECYARIVSVSLHHIVGSATMGAEGSPGAVVDTQLRVVGVTGLRVMDASIMPRVPIGNTNAPAIMIAEKGTDMIISLWKGTRLGAPIGGDEEDEGRY
ncbi:unnamed protein product [Orchesella dallaii]|uniref:Glucose dehydrogenase [FAD, quinone] n=1 Tax=Orchesella dallaii TaxID=48710 RepID=A0ABP1QXI8_9HEXA